MDTRRLLKYKTWDQRKSELLNLEYNLEAELLLKNTIRDEQKSPKFITYEDENPQPPVKKGKKVRKMRKFQAKKHHPKDYDEIEDFVLLSAEMAKNMSLQNKLHNIKKPRRQDEVDIIMVQAPKPQPQKAVNLYANDCEQQMFRDMQRQKTLKQVNDAISIDDA